MEASTTALHARRDEIMAELRTEITDDRADELEAELRGITRRILLRVRYLGMAR